MDDTLIVCGKYYEEAKRFLYGLAAQVTTEGDMPSHEDFIRLFDLFDHTRIDQGRVKIKDRFPTSLGLFYELWCKEHGLRCDTATTQRAIKAGYDIYEQVFPTMPGACQMLEDLAKTHRRRRRGLGQHPYRAEPRGDSAHYPTPGGHRRMSKDTGASKNNKKPVEGWTCKGCGHINPKGIGGCGGVVHTRVLAPKDAGGPGLRTHMTHVPCNASR
jgi:hypothetical protein